MRYYRSLIGATDPNRRIFLHLPFCCSSTTASTSNTTAAAGSVSWKWAAARRNRPGDFNGRRSYSAEANPNLKMASVQKIRKHSDIHRIRNIGIMAHIDAGKTTTTERFLYYAGATRTMGDVDSGNTMTDYMAQERERGITITSAAITLHWAGYQLNLIDTPGHVDFTLEVERCLRVLDGAVGVLDGSAGVEAQTLTVWRQAKKFEIPAILFINKMDKQNASFSKSVQSIRDKLRTVPLVLNRPLISKKHRQFLGIYDLLTMKELEWPADKEHDGRTYRKVPITKDHPEYESLAKGREDLIGTLAENDEDFAELMLGKDSIDDLSVEDEIVPAIRRATLARKLVPVLCGSSLKNRGVQPVIDAVCSYLPDPTETKQHQFLSRHFKDSPGFVGLAFKIRHDARLGALTFIRIYAGTLRPMKTIYNATKDVSEAVPKIFISYSDEIDEVKSISTGNIALVPGMKNTITGDTLSDTKNTLIRLNQSICSDDQHVNVPYVLDGIDRPEPVYFCSIEAPSQGTQLKLDEALEKLVREDPSVMVRYDEQSGQNILMTMGELHLEIIKDRLNREFKLDVFIGPLQINYKEFVDKEATATLEREEQIGCGKLNKLKFISHSNVRSVAETRQDFLKALLTGCQSACQYGPLLGFPIMDVEVTVEQFECSNSTSYAIIQSSANKCLSDALTEAGTKLLEPIMKLELSCSDETEDTVISELVRRRAEIISNDIEMDEAGNFTGVKKLVAQAPLADLERISSELRRLSRGTVGFHMELAGYRALTEEQQMHVYDKLTGRV